ncbi:MAG: type II and III secretion system protein family protein [Alphaproteobacteria bacterium]
MRAHKASMKVVIILAGLLGAFSAEASQLVKVELSKGSMIKLDSPIVSVVVADPETADVQVVSPRLLFVRGKKVGETSLYAVNDTDETVLDATVEVTHNISKLNRMVRQVAPDADIEFNTVDGGMVMEGNASSALESENIRSMAEAFIGQDDKMVNMVNTGGSDQVTLQVKIVEMARTDVKRFGINMQALFGAGGMALQVLQGQDIALASGVLNRAGTDTALFGSWTNRGRANISGFVEALEEEGLANVLAEPNLTTSSGKPASFLAGGEFPITVSTGDGEVSVSYRPFGVSLNFTPTVLSKDKISINVAPEVSTISFDNPVTNSGINNPIILTRRAQATVELGSGQTFALAGLLRNDHSNTVDKYPGLGDVPVLGALFRSSGFQNNQTELVILVTPYIVRPVSNHALQTPLDGFKAPSDFEQLLLGSFYEQEPMTTEEPMPKLSGEGGFILE